MMDGVQSIMGKAQDGVAQTGRPCACRGTLDLTHFLSLLLYATRVSVFSSKNWTKKTERTMDGLHICFQVRHDRMQNNSREVMKVINNFQRLFEVSKRIMNSFLIVSENT